MQEGQKQFYDYILDRVEPQFIEKAKALLNENFKKQDRNVFHKEDLQAFHHRIIPCLKAEAVEEVKAVMKQFGPQELS